MSASGHTSFSKTPNNRIDSSNNYYCRHHDQNIEKIRANRERGHALVPVIR